MPNVKYAARIVAIGDELLLGKRVDTNTAWLAKWCLERGLAVRGTRIVADDIDDIVAAFLEGLEQADLVLVTGGLGPTEDDRTREAVARAIEVPLVESKRAWQQVVTWYRKNRPDYEVPLSNKRQAMIPKGAKILANDRGTAPGCLAGLGGSYIACFPGVPHEMKAMVDRMETILPELLPELIPDFCEELYLAGIGESAVQDQLGKLLAPAKSIQIGITAHEAGHMTIRCVGAPTAVKRRMSQIRRKMASAILPEDGLAESLVSRLSALGATIAVAESCTCGAVLARIGEVPGASRVLRNGWITYADEAKMSELAVAPSLIKTHGVVSEPVVSAMAQGALARSGADIAVATSGIAGPTGGTKTKPVGMVTFAVAHKSGAVTAQTLQIPGSRSRVQHRSAANALLMAWQAVDGGIAGVGG